MNTDEATLRQDVVAAARRINAIGLNPGTSGNISVRFGELMLITPSATAYEDMQPDDIAALRFDGPPGAWQGPLPPSTEWRMHQEILRGRSDAGAVIHTHATYCTVLSILRREIPAIHYMIALFGGPTIRCAPYATFGTAALATLALQALADRHACLLANHGMVVVGPTLARATRLAAELETLAKLFCHALRIGTPTVLSDAEVVETARRFETYGLPAPDTGE